MHSCCALTSFVSLPCLLRVCCCPLAQAGWAGRGHPLPDEGHPSTAGTHSHAPALRLLPSATPALARPPGGPVACRSAPCTVCNPRAALCTAPCLTILMTRPDFAASCVVIFLHASNAPPLCFFTYGSYSPLVLTPVLVCTHPRTRTSRAVEPPPSVCCRSAVHLELTRPGPVAAVDFSFHSACSPLSFICPRASPLSLSHALEPSPRSPRSPSLPGTSSLG